MFNNHKIESQGAWGKSSFRLWTTKGGNAYAGGGGEANGKQRAKGQMHASLWPRAKPQWQKLETLRHRFPVTDIQAAASKPQTKQPSLHKAPAKEGIEGKAGGLRSGSSKYGRAEGKRPQLKAKVV